MSIKTRSEEYAKLDKVLHELIVLVPLVGVEEGIVSKVEYTRMLSSKRRELLNAKSGRNGEKVLTKLIADCLFSVNGQVIESNALATKIAQQLSTVDRELLLYKIRTKTLGAVVETSTVCTNELCGERSELVVDLSKVTLEKDASDIHYAKDGVPFVKLDFDDEGENYKSSMRMANGEDAELCFPLIKTNRLAAADKLKNRCCLGLNGEEKPTLEQMDEMLPPKAFDKLSLLYNKIVPRTDFKITQECDECGDVSAVRMNIVETLFLKDED